MIEKRYRSILAATDFWMYLLVWSELGTRPAWIKGRSWRAEVGK